MTWEARRTADGSWTLFHAGLGEACHSLAGAWEQAVERYAGACRIAERVQHRDAREFRLLDVGTGLGLNVAAALAAAASGAGELSVLSCELDPEVIERGCRLYELPELQHGPWAPWHALVRPALRAALEHPGEEVRLGARGRLELRLGDARVALQERAIPPQDAVFLDPFSPRRAPELWEDSFLIALARCMAPQSWLSTYSASFRVRLGLARAGLRVGRGPRVGTKGEGTLASPDLEPPELPSRTARRLARRAQGLFADSLARPAPRFRLESTGMQAADAVFLDQETRTRLGPESRS